LLPVIVKALQDLSEENAQLKLRIEQLENKTKNL
jgi:cell division septum initiation protein DivIVA